VRLMQIPAPAAWGQGGILPNFSWSTSQHDPCRWSWFQLDGPGHWFQLTIAAMRTLRWSCCAEVQHGPGVPGQATAVQADDFPD